MKAILEQIAGEPAASFACRAFNWKRFPFLWHFHPQIELTLILAGRGQRLVGDSIDRFAEGDLVLLGSNLPHTWHSSPDLPQRVGVCRSIVIQFRSDLLGADCFERLPELRPVGALLQRAHRGLVFCGRGRDAAADLMQEMVQATPIDRLAMLLRCLGGLAVQSTVRPLSSQGFRAELTHFGRHRISEVCAFLSREFTNPVRLESAASIACLSPGAFSRFFFKSTGKHFTDYVNELRIARACELMIESELKIAAIAFQAGFGNVSNFNRQFLRRKSCTPASFRQLHWRV